MSFIVSYKGQFSPYKLPDLSYLDDIRNIYHANKTKELKRHEEDDFENELAYQKGKKNTNNKIKNLVKYKQTQKLERKFKISQLARDLMASNVHCLKTTDTLTIAKQEMDKLHYRHFPILDDNTLVGIISDRDMLKNSGRPNSTQLKDIMTEEVLTALDTTRIQDIAKIMLHEKISCLPIINDKHIIVGIITQTNILDYVIRSVPLEIWS